MPFSGAVSVLRGNGDGTFQPLVENITGVSGEVLLGDPDVSFGTLVRMALNS